MAPSGLSGAGQSVQATADPSANPAVSEPTVDPVPPVPGANAPAPRFTVSGPRDSMNCFTAGANAMQWILNIRDAGPSALRFIAMASHDDTPGCAATERNPCTRVALGGVSDYTPHSSGQTTFTFDPKMYNCGRVQVDVSIFDAAGNEILIVGVVINYGATCAPPTAPLVCQPPAQSALVDQPVSFTAYGRYWSLLVVGAQWIAGFGQRIGVRDQLCRFRDIHRDGDVGQRYRNLRGHGDDLGHPATGLRAADTDRAGRPGRLGHCCRRHRSLQLVGARRIDIDWYGRRLQHVVFVIRAAHHHSNEWRANSHLCGHGACQPDAGLRPADGSDRSDRLCSRNRRQRHLQLVSTRRIDGHWFGRQLQHVLCGSRRAHHHGNKWRGNSHLPGHGARHPDAGLRTADADGSDRSDRLCWRNRRQRHLQLVSTRRIDGHWFGRQLQHILCGSRRAHDYCD